MAVPQVWRGSPLHAAIRNNDVVGVSQLLQRDADPNEKDTLGNTPLIAALSPSALLEPLPTDDPSGRRAEIQREHAARIRMIADLLRAGANPSLAGSRGMTPLIALAHWGYTSTADLRLLDDLVARGAKLDAQNDDGDTALIVAARRGKVEMVQALLKRGASATLTNCAGQTPAAAGAKHPAVVRILSGNR